MGRGHRPASQAGENLESTLFFGNGKTRFPQEFGKSWWVISFRPAAGGGLSAVVSPAGRGQHRTRHTSPHRRGPSGARARGPHLLLPSRKERARPAFHSKGTAGPRWSLGSSAHGRRPPALARGEEGTSPRWSPASPELQRGRDLRPGWFQMGIEIARGGRGPETALQTPAEPTAPLPVRRGPAGGRPAGPRA